MEDVVHLLQGWSQDGPLLDRRIMDAYRVTRQKRMA
jgi:hypothetical protein